jgi:glycerol-3-phosphate O-acyltransferase
MDEHGRIMSPAGAIIVAAPMTSGSEIAVPLWLVVPIAALAAWALAADVALPAFRAVVRWRGNRVLEDVATRRRIRIEPFRLTRRQVLVDRLVNDPLVVEAAEAKAAEEGVPRDEVMARIGVYAREIVPAFNAYFYFRIGYVVTRAAAKLLYRVRLGYADEAGIAAIAPRSTVVFVMNHRSNMDYILVSFLAAERTALSYAVGEWARIFPVESLNRATGAYFVRRNSKDPLYRRVLERYVQMATTAGVTQAVFPEGGLSRDGKLRPPRVGLLDYMLRAFDPAAERDIVFVPVGINYDRTLEDRTLLLDLDPSAPRRKGLGAARTTLGFVLQNLALMLKSEWHRFGYACVNFGTPVSLKAWLAARGVDPRALGKEARIARVEELAKALMASIAAVVPVVPVSLVATLFAREPDRVFSGLELKAEALRLLHELAAKGAHVYFPRGDQDYAIGVGLRMLTLRKLVVEPGPPGLFVARKEELPILRYYAGSIAHWV